MISARISIVYWPYPAFGTALLAEVTRQVAEVLGARLDSGASAFSAIARQIAPAVSGQDHAVDSIGDLKMPGNPSGRHQRGHRDRQDGDLGRETGSRGEFIEHAPQREFGEPAGHKEIPRTMSAVVVIHAWPLLAHGPAVDANDLPRDEGRRRADQKASDLGRRLRACPSGPGGSL